MSIHDPIPQFFEPCNSCPYCGGKGIVHGAIDTPPIALQLDDAQRGVTREWQATRWYCWSYQCGGMWDVVSVNVEKARNHDLHKRRT